MDHRIITAPVTIPNKPDCDLNKGEPPLTQEQVKHLKETYENYLLIDYDHNLTIPTSKWHLKLVGKPIKSWISTKPTTYTNVLGKTETIPRGTWWLTTKVTDPQLIKWIDEGLVTAYSITVGNKEFCDKFMQQMKQSHLAPKNNTNSTLPCSDGMLAFKKTLIKDIKNPVGFTVSLTGLPCQGSATFSRTCYDNSKRFSKKNGGQQMTETNETRFSISDLLGLQKLFATKKDEDAGKNTPAEEEETPSKQPEQDNDEFVSQKEFKEKIGEIDEKIGEIDGKVDKILEKLDPKEEDENKGEGDEGKDGSGKNDEDENKGQTANKNNPTPSSQLDNSDDANNQNNTANKNNRSTKAKLMTQLNRKGNGQYKFPRNY